VHCYNDYNLAKVRHRLKTGATEVTTDDALGVCELGGVQTLVPYSHTILLLRSFLLL